MTGDVLRKIKKVVLKNLVIFTGMESLFNEVAGLRPAALLKRDSNARVFLYCEIFKNTYFEKHLQTIASEDRINNT